MVGSPPFGSIDAYSHQSHYWDSRSRFGSHLAHINKLLTHYAKGTLSSMIGLQLLVGTLVQDLFHSSSTFYFIHSLAVLFTIAVEVYAA